MKYILLICIVCYTVVLTAIPISKNQALQVAENWTNKWAPKDFTQRTITKTISLPDSESPLLYLFQYTNGFVLTSADDIATPILGYSYDAIVNEINQNPAFHDFMECRQEEIRQLKEQGIDNTVTSDEWRSILANDFSRNDTRAVLPLLSTKWNQGWPYNMLCPADASGSGGHVYAGCVATAMGQVMKYWNWPNTGVGSHSYNAFNYGQQSANFGQATYNWNIMPRSVSLPNEEVAKLLYHCGVAVEMGYSPDGSGAQSYDAVDALEQYFRYNPGILLREKQSYSSSAWDQLLKTELDNVRPMYYHGFGNSSGHAFVCDGYQGTNYFHFNWGWSGAYDGYFYTSSLNPGSSFNWGQAAMFNVYPINYNISMVQLTLESTDCQVGDEIPVTISSYPIMPQWNVNSTSFIFEYDNEAMIYQGFDLAGTLLDGAAVDATIIQPGQIAFSINTTSNISGAGKLIQLNFQPFLNGNYSFTLDGFNYNSTPVTAINPTSINVLAEIAEPQNSVIDLLNALHIPPNQIATIPINTTYILPTWNITTISFSIQYPIDKVTWEEYDTSECLAENALISVESQIPGIVNFIINFPALIYGGGNLINLKFRATCSLPVVSMATITPIDFYYGETLIQNLLPGFIILLPVTANEDAIAVPDIKLSISPNPVRNNASLSIVLPKQNRNVAINVYNAKGQLVRNLHNGITKGNELNLNWDGRDGANQDVHSGIYFIKVKSEEYQKTVKLLRL